MLPGGVVSDLHGQSCGDEKQNETIIPFLEQAQMKADAFE